MSTADSARDVELELRDVALAGTLTVPAGSDGLVIFVHGSGSSRFSPRNRYVAGELNAAGLGTLLFDLLTAGEEGDRTLVFDIELLAGRLGEVTDLVRTEAAWIGYFGASTGAAAALWAAADPDREIAAVVSRGGRPDLAMPRLGRVRAPHAHARRRPGPHGDRTEPAGCRGPAVRTRPADRARGDAPVRGTRHARGRGAAGAGLVPRPPPSGLTGAQHTWCRKPVQLRRIRTSKTEHPRTRRRLTGLCWANTGTVDTTAQSSYCDGGHKTG